MSGTNFLLVELALAKTLLWSPASLPSTTPVPEPESAAYGAHSLSVGGREARFRVGKATPTKAGHFLTLWQRSEAGPIRPFDVSDGVELFIVQVRDGERHGQFVFPVETLLRRGVVATAGKGGKRAMRVYAPWVETSSAQAAKTQTWQCEHFLSLNAPDVRRVQELYRA